MVLKRKKMKKMKKMSQIYRTSSLDLDRKNEKWFLVLFYNIYVYKAFNIKQVTVYIQYYVMLCYI